MSTAETLYTFRRPYADTLQRARQQTVQLEAYGPDGALAAPASGTFSLFDPAGTAVIDGEDVSVPGSIAQYQILAAQLPATLECSDLYTQRWVLVMPDGTTRTVIRECALAPFPVQPSVSEPDLLEEYPDLLGQLGTDTATLQPWLDAAWKRVLRKLWKVEQWPDLMLSTDAFFDVQFHKTLELVFKYLFRINPTDHWKTLWDHHSDECAKAWGELTSRRDNDFDGIPDSARRESATTVVHRNVVPLAQRTITSSRF